MTARIVALLLALVAFSARNAEAQSLPPAVLPAQEEVAVTAEPIQGDPVLPEGFTRIGDMIVEPVAAPQAATGFHVRTRPWPGGILPIIFESTVTLPQRQRFYELCNGVWGGTSNVRCVDRTNQAAWVQVIKSSSGCYSQLGTTGTGAHYLNLQDNMCWTDRTVLHEIGHSLGLMHEHQRPGRDLFVDIRLQNVRSGLESEFVVMNQSTIDYSGQYYDYQSIMHYGATAGSWNGQPTIAVWPHYASYATGMGTLNTPSQYDHAAITAVYGAAVKATLPGAPTAFQASTTGKQVNLSWRAPASGGTPTSYQVTIKTPLGAVLWSGDIGNYLGANGTFNSGTYVFDVQARNAAGLGPAATVQVTVGSTVGGRPGAPSNLGATVQGANITLSWSAPVTPGPVQTYVLHYGFTPGFASVNTIDLGTSTRIAVTAPAGTYHLRVSARNQFGSSTESNEIRVSVGGVTAPGTPSLLPVEGRGGNTYRIVWQSGAGAAATSYLMDVAATPNGAPYASLPMTGTEWVGPAPAGTYYLRLRAVNAAGTSAPSNLQILYAR